MNRIPPSICLPFAVATLVLAQTAAGGPFDLRGIPTDRAAFARLMQTGGVSDELQENEPTDRLFDSRSDPDADDFDAGESAAGSDHDAESDGEPGDAASGDDDHSDSQAASIRSRIERLRKPTTQIAIDGSFMGQARPQDRAGSVAEPSPPSTITATDAPLPLPNRYTIGSLHRPLYFEQRNLERCGRGCGCWQNGVSGVQFLYRTILLPYHIAAECPDELVCDGDDCLTCQSYGCDCNPLPLDHHGIVAETAAIAGFAFLVL